MHGSSSLYKGLIFSVLQMKITPFYITLVKPLWNVAFSIEAMDHYSSVREAQVKCQEWKGHMLQVFYRT